MSGAYSLIRVIWSFLFLVASLVAMASVKEIRGQPTIDLETAAKVLGISRGHAYSLAREGAFPGLLRLGRRYRVSTVALLRFLEADGDGRVEHDN